MKEFLKQIDYAKLDSQKEFLLNHGGPEALGLAHLIDKLQDVAFVELGGDIVVKPLKPIN